MNQTRKVPAFFRKRVLKYRVNLCDKKQYCIKFGFFNISWSKIIQTSKNRSPLERYFQGLSFERNFVFLAQVLEEIRLFQVDLCDQTLVRFSSLAFFHVYPLHFHRGSSKHPNMVTIWKKFSKAIIWAQFCHPSLNILGDMLVSSWSMWPNFVQIEQFGVF